MVQITGTDLIFCICEELPPYQMDMFLSHQKSRYRQIHKQHSYEDMEANVLFQSKSINLQHNQSSPLKFWSTVDVRAQPSTKTCQKTSHPPYSPRSTYPYSQCRWYSKFQRNAHSSCATSNNHWQSTSRNCFHGS